MKYKNGINTILIKNTDIKYWICSVLLFMMSYPKWMWNVDIRIGMTAFSLVLLLLALKDITKVKYSVLSVIAFFLQFYILWVYFDVGVQNSNGVLMLLLTWLGFAPIFLCSSTFWRRTMDCFVTLLGVLLALAIAEHLLYTFIGVQLVSAKGLYCPINPDRPYDVFLFTVYLSDTAVFDFVKRFFAFYNEPGELGSFMVALLFWQRYNFKKWYNIVFLISGLLSFSLAFYIALIAWYIIFGKRRSKIVFGLIASLAVIFFYKNEILYSFIFGRIQFEGGSLSGYNRENYIFSDWFNYIGLDEYFLHGYSDRIKMEYSASWKWALVCWGVVPLFVYYVTLLLSMINSRTRNNKDTVIAVSLMVIFFIQHPFLYLFFYLLMIILPL